jgi:hypothetical protein
VKRARATGTASIFNIDHYVDTRQMFGQSPTIHLALVGRSALPWCRNALFLGFGCGDTLLEIFQAERQLIGIELLRPSAEAMTLQRHDDSAQPVAFRGMLHPFGDEQRTQRFRVSGKIVDIGGHVVRCTALGSKRKIFSYPRVNLSQAIASLAVSEPQSLGRASNRAPRSAPRVATASGA